MTTCAYCGAEVKGQKFCSECGKAVEQQAVAAAAPAADAVVACPRCGGTAQAASAFCNHCGAPLHAQVQATPAASQPLYEPAEAAPGASQLLQPVQPVQPVQQMAINCPTCHAPVPSGNTFCTNCGQSLASAQAATAPPAPAPAFCTNCGRQNAPGVRFCAGCGSPMGVAGQTGYMQPQYGQQYPQQPQYGQQYPQQPQYPQQYPQQPLVLHCPVCMAMSPLGTQGCPGCHTSLVGVAPAPATMPMQSQQGGLLGGLGLGGMMQGNTGKYAMGALGGAAAVIGGEMLMHGLENRGDDRGYGYGYERRDEGLFGELGNLGNDLGLL